MLHLINLTVCKDGDHRFYNERSYYTYDGLLRVTAIPQTCEDGGWVTICNDGTNNENLPNIICQEAGYRGSIKRLNIVFFNHFLYCLGGYELSPNRTMFGASGPGTFYINNVHL